VSWEVSEEELRAVLRLPAPKRYEYFVKRIVDWQELWGLRDGQGFAVSAASSGRQLFAVWPHRRYAEACAVGEWAGRTAAPIGLGEWLNGWLPELEEDGHAVAVFPDPNGNAINREPAELAADLQAEAQRYR
jgi:hypothetical protein